MVSSKKQCEEAYVLDTTAFYVGIPYIGTNKFYTTPLVICEIPNTTKILIPELIESRKLEVIEPPSYLFNHVKRLAKKSGDIGTLSNTDISILSLALQLEKEGLKPIVISDDYSVQNLSKFLGFKFSRLSTNGISNKIEWLIYCIGCGKTFKNGETTICDNCGTKLKRKAKIKNKI